MPELTNKSIYLGRGMNSGWGEHHLLYTFLHVLCIPGQPRLVLCISGETIDDLTALCPRKSQVSGILGNYSQEESFRLLSLM
jgi:hypothetical protein